MITFKDFIQEGIADAGILKAVFVVGIPGAGKSYTVSQLKGVISPKVINSDRVTEYLSKKFNVISTDANWKSFFRDKTKPLTAASLYQYLNGMLPVFIDGTSNNTSYILGRSGILESLGYDVGMVFINTNLDVALARAKKRGEEINRHVNPDFIKQVHATSEENKEFFKSKFSFFKELNNNPGELDDAAMLQAFKQVQGFYAKPVQNPVGKRIIEQLKEDKEKYLVPSAMSKEELQKKVEGWYR